MTGWSKSFPGRIVKSQESTFPKILEVRVVQMTPLIEGMVKTHPGAIFKGEQRISTPLDLLTQWPAVLGHLLRVVTRMEHVFVNHQVHFDLIIRKRMNM